MFWSVDVSYKDKDTLLLGYKKEREVLTGDEDVGG
jgi:hypothetical protein